MIDFWPDKGTGGTVPVEYKGGVLYGDPVIKRFAAALRAARVPLYAQHKDTCVKRNSSRKTP